MRRVWPIAGAVALMMLCPRDLPAAAGNALEELRRLVLPDERLPAPPTPPAKPILPPAPDLDGPVVIGEAAVPMPLCRWLDPSASGTGLAAGLSPEQRRVLESFAAEESRRAGENLAPEQVLRRLNRSQVLTFEAVTQALEKVGLEDSDGGEPRTALGLVEALLEIHGRGETGQGRTQYRIIVSLREGALRRLERARDFSRGRSGHVYRAGRLTKHLRDFRLKNGPPSVQFSVTDDGRTADIDIDYRKVFEGHLKPYNSDVMAAGPEKDGSRPIDNLRRHTGRWGPFMAPGKLILLDCLDRP